MSRNRKYAYCTDREANIQVELISLQVFQFFSNKSSLTHARPKILTVVLVRI